ncbi:hypothetical protein H310_09965 [Aphanomyces invadans]|uniref:SH3 domain-containing protein n=1 Tax=Aphanomyces invadans TaxID=157072 RepID=A0A024TUZ0_9STRA|nr:hypothetical protein H310_09965 [Aphanomyces invadans]ETV97167.1 hypothetical protein H310_09965 [Aphanomyces invadans]|eukprot:XP_008874413.1 hypothetical protein H310_09965 [Aphanomyces invadans]
MLPALTTKPKQPIKQIRGLTNDSIDSYANTPVGSTNANVTTTTYSDLTEHAGKKQKAKEESDAANDDGDGTTVCVVARALRDRKPKSDEELTLKTGDVLNVYSTKKTGYLKCECNGKTGYVPASYVEFLDKETGEPSPRKSGKKKKSKKKSKRKKDRGSGSSEEVDEDEPDDEDVGRKKTRDKHSKKKDVDDDVESDDGKEDNDNGGSRSKKSKKKHSARKSSRSRRKKRHSSDSNSSDDDTSRRRHRRRHRSRRRRGHDDDDDDSDSPHSSDEDSEEERRRRRRAKKKENEGVGGSDDEESDRGSPKKKTAAPKETRGDDRPQEKPKTTGSAKNESTEEDKENGQSQTSASTSTAATSTKDKQEQQMSARRKDNEVREETTTKSSTATTASSTSSTPKSTIGKMQDKMRSMLGKKTDGASTKKPARAKTQSNGILNACPGTVQGEEGWYEHGECERYYFILVDGKWSLLYGPMTDDDFELFCSKVLEYDLMIELPATHLHKSGYYLDKDFKVRHIKP